MNKNVLQIIACPFCKKNLKKTNFYLECVSCKKKYRILNNIPIFYEEFTKDKIFQITDNNNLGREMGYKFFDTSLKTKIQKFIGNLFFLSEDRMLNKTDKFRKLIKKGVILNVGSGMKKESRKDINLDIGIFGSVDIVGDGHDLPIKSNSVEMVVCRYVLEHVRNPNKVVKEIYRALKPGGIVYIEVPFIQRFHGYPYDFQRYTKLGLLELMKQFKTEEIGTAGGPTTAIIELIINYLKILSMGHNWLFSIYFIPFAIPLMLMKNLDKVIIKWENSHELAISLYYVGKKK